MQAVERPPHVLNTPKWTLIIHAIQAFLAIIILGLNAYGIRWIAYNVLIYSLVCCLCTLGVVAYIFVSTLFAHKLYNVWAHLALHMWMVVFWIVQFSLVANLAAIWNGPSCSYSPYYGYSCSYYKRDLSGLQKRDSTSYGAYFGALAAGAVFGAFEFVLWVAALIVLGIHLHRHRRAGNPSQPPPTYSGPANDQAIAMEKPNYQGQPQPQQAQPQQNYVPQQPQQVYNQTTGPQFNTPYTQPQDPVNRVHSISPITVAGQPQNYASPAMNTSELASPQHTGNYSLPPSGHVAELNTTPSYPTNAAEMGTQK